MSMYPPHVPKCRSSSVAQLVLGELAEFSLPAFPRVAAEHARQRRIRVPITGGCLTIAVLHGLVLRHLVHKPVGYLMPELWVAHSTSAWEAMKPLLAIGGKFVRPKMRGKIIVPGHAPPIAIRVNNRRGERIVLAFSGFGTQYPNGNLTFLMALVREFGLTPAFAYKPQPGHKLWSTHIRIAAAELKAARARKAAT